MILTREQRRLKIFIDNAEDLSLIFEKEEERDEQYYQQCCGCGKIFHIYEEGSDDMPEWCDSCWCKNKGGLSE